MKNKILYYAFFMFCMILSAFTLKSYDHNAATGLGIGGKAKDFSLKNVDGKKISMSQYPEAKGFIVVFTCNHCPFSKLYEQRIIDLDNTYKPKGFPVIAISSNDPAIEPDDSFEKMVELANAKKYPFPYLYDSTQEVAKNFGAAKTPHVYVLAKKNKDLIVSYIGAIDDNPKKDKAETHAYVADAVQALLENKKVALTETKAVGCSIKWKE
ncbi:MAG: thioredoxin family protein [Cytophagales bacterium]|nr:MAG: thioredoxin family protein [Cytophagales bacterium]TAF62056.1 MAG: thioredoxin family protein [Cytophagales bacterium]